MFDGTSWDIVGHPLLKHSSCAPKVEGLLLIAVRNLLLQRSLVRYFSARFQAVVAAGKQWPDDAFLCQKDFAPTHLICDDGYQGGQCVQLPSLLAMRAQWPTLRRVVWLTTGDAVTHGSQGVDAVCVAPVDPAELSSALRELDTKARR